MLEYYKRRILELRAAIEKFLNLYDIEMDTGTAKVASNILLLVDECNKDIGNYQARVDEINDKR